MKKYNFPYSITSRMYIFNAKSPLGEYYRLLLDNRIFINDSPFHEAEDISQEMKVLGLDLIADRLSVSLNVLTVGLERFLNQLDRNMCLLLNGVDGIRWPPASGRWPHVPRSKPYNFFYYKIDHVINHWHCILGITIKHQKLKLVKDCIQFRHVWSHCAGVVSQEDVRKFKYYKVKKGVILLPSYDGYNDMCIALKEFAQSVNDQLGIAMLSRLRRSVFSWSWKSDKKLFISILDCFSWFGALKCDLRLAKELYKKVQMNTYDFNQYFQPL